MGILVIVVAIAIAALTSLETRGVKLLGEVPQGLPRMGLPAVQLSDLNELLPLGLACFMLGAVETAAIGRMFGAKHRYRFDANQEFLGLAVSNLMAGLGRGFPVSGGMSQSLVNEGSGAQTSLSGLVAAAMMLVVSVFFSSSLRYLPQPVLAATVLMAVTGLFKPSDFRHLWKVDRSEFAVAIAALLGVLGSGLLRGVLIGAVIALVQLCDVAPPARRISRSHPGHKPISDLDRNPDNLAVPGIPIFRVEASLLYFNVNHVCDAVLKRVRGELVPPRLVLFDLSATPHVDLQGADALRGLADELTALGMRMRVVEARSSVRDRLRAEGLDDKLGGIRSIWHCRPGSGRF